MRRLLHYRLILLHYRAVITLPGDYYIIGCNMAGARWWLEIDWIKQ